EWKSQGTRAVIASGIRADAAIVTEPTGLAIGRAHKGFAWLELTVHGVAAHGSAHAIGVDAITHAALVLAELDAFQRATLATHAHPLLGPASLHASTIAGGSGLSTYPDRCVVHIERRTLPGEAADAPLREVQDAIARAQRRAPGLRAEVVEQFAQPPSEVDAGHAVVRALDAAIRARGDTPRVEGFGYWTDAALFTAAGVPAVLFGPGDIGLAHSATEWIALDELERGTQLLADAIGRFFNA
ncbi:MAG: M20/M25/M40 family metallo-hydrolase, partial [Gemmatimonadaceae bacterium]|nr:M20/M25/M40 family metallo-hydrolase [Gemmatimonadaceae bacterium]